MSSQRARGAQARDTRATELLDACVAAARTAAEFIGSQGKARAAGTLDWHAKQRADFVSEVDTGAETRIRDVLVRLVPDAIIWGEELSPETVTGAETVFIVDPLDGTTNYLHGYPQYAVSIGAVHDGELSAGAVLDVPRNVLYVARRGAGAFRDGQPIRVSALRDPTLALIGTGFPFKHLDRLEEYLRQFTSITRGTAGIRRAGSAALDLVDVACGRFEGFWELSLAPWDIAAGLLLVREAGGRVTDLRGEEVRPRHGEVVASNGVLHDWLLEALR